MTRIQSLVHICRILAQNVKFKSDDFSNGSIYDVLMDIAPTFDDTIIACKWHDFEECGCPAYIVPVLTNYGVCFAFNALNSYDIYTEE